MRIRITKTIVGLWLTACGLFSGAAISGMEVVLQAPDGSEKFWKETFVRICLGAAKASDAPIFKPDAAVKVKNIKSQLAAKRDAKQISLVGFVKDGVALVDQDMLPRSGPQTDDTVESPLALDYVACLLSFGYKWPGQVFDAGGVNNSRATDVGGEEPGKQKRDVIANRQWNNVAVSADGKRIVVAACDRDGSILVESRDGGTNWGAKKVAVGRLGGCIYGLALAEGGTLVAGSHTGIYFSIDDGGSWREATVNSHGKRTRLGSLFGFQFDSSGRNGWALTMLDDGRAYKTGDGGRSWETVQVGEGAEIHTAIWADPAGQKIWIGGQKGSNYWGPSFMLRSTDGGLTWKRTLLEGKGFVADIVFDQSGVVGQALGMDGLLYNTNDSGETWSIEKIQILDAGAGWAGAVAGNQGSMGCAVGDGVLVKGLDGRWAKTLSTEKLMRFERRAVSSDNKTVVGTGYAKVFISKDGCNSWKRVSVYQDLQ